MNIHSDTLNPFHAFKIDVSETGDNSGNPDLVSDIEDKKVKLSSAENFTQAISVHSCATLRCATW